MKPWRCVLPILLGLATAIAAGAEDRWLAVIGGTVFDGTGAVHVEFAGQVRMTKDGHTEAVPITKNIGRSGALLVTGVWRIRPLDGRAGLTG